MAFHIFIILCIALVVEDICSGRAGQHSYVLGVMIILAHRHSGFYYCVGARLTNKSFRRCHAEPLSCSSFRYA